MLDEAQVRREKLQKLIELGINPYPADSARDTSCADALERFGDLMKRAETITLAGRVLTIRVHGGMMFADLSDGGEKIQIAFKEDHLDANTFKLFRDLIDPGDIVEATGKLFLTKKRDEKTLEVASWRILAKALLPLPEKWHGLQDVEARYRQRELDLICNPEVKQRFIVRSKLISSLRHFLDERGFLEVETPIWQAVPGGANSRPFITHHNALDTDLYLRIAPELYLKRLMVGGFEKIYEIARCFRNEGIDHAHNPEFTQIELYWAYAGKERFIAFLEEMLRTILMASVGTLTIEYGENGDRRVHDFSRDFEKKTFKRAVFDNCRIDVDLMKTPDDVLEACERGGLDLKRFGIDFSRCVGVGEYLDELYKKTARSMMIGRPVWITDYPVAMIPLAGRSPDDPTKSATAQLVVNGVEIIKAFYHELNDPLDQRQRLEEQQALIEKGSEEAQHLDESFLRALEHGMPPASGLGMGIDRLISLITGTNNLKEVILFPTLKPKAPEASDV